MNEGAKLSTHLKLLHFIGLHETISLRKPGFPLGESLNCSLGVATCRNWNSTAAGFEAQRAYPTPIEPPVRKERAKRLARFAEPGERKNRHTCPTVSILLSHRVPQTNDTDRSEIEQALMLLSLKRPTAFIPSEPPTEQELFEECSLGIYRVGSRPPKDTSRSPLVLRRAQKYQPCFGS